MKESKIVKARCKKTGTYYGVVLEKFFLEWKAVDVIPMSDEQARVLTSEVRQRSFETNDNLQACRTCGNRKIGGCKCTENSYSCKKKEYHFPCIYCHNMEIDYTEGRGSGRTEITLEQGRKVQITFSNVTWQKFDRIQTHPTADRFRHIEPKVHAVGVSVGMKALLLHR